MNHEDALKQNQNEKGIDIELPYKVQKYRGIKYKVLNGRNMK